MGITEIISLIGIGTELIGYISKIRTAAKQTGEWTDEAEAAYNKMLDDDASAPEWQPEIKPS